MKKERKLAVGLGIATGIGVGIWAWQKAQAAPECSVDNPCREGFECIDGKCVAIEPPPDMATLTGKVTDSVTGAAIDGISVSLNGLQDYTDGLGKYLIPSIVPGEYAQVDFVDPQGVYEPLTVYSL